MAKVAACPLLIVKLTVSVLFELERAQEVEEEKEEGADIPHCKEGVTTPLDISPKLFTIEKRVVLFAKPFELVNTHSHF